MCRLGERRYRESQQYDRLFSNAPARGKVAIPNDRSGAFGLFFLRWLVKDSQPSIVFGYRPNPVSGQFTSCVGVGVHTAAAGCDRCDEAYSGD